MDVWATVADERVALSDALRDVEPEAWWRPSLCGGWTVQDVVAHLVVLAEAPAPWRFILRGALVDPRPNKSVDKMARRLSAAASTEELAARLAAAKDGRFVVPGMPPTVALGEVLVHRADISEVAGLPRHAPDDALRAALEAELKLWFAFGVSRSMRRHRFVATDGEWSIGLADAPVVAAPGEELLRIVTGRRAVAGNTSTS
jgi:uncharacterized protein (TIGR03083 family)